MRFLRKFNTGDFVHNKKTNYIGIVDPESSVTKDKMVVYWLYNKKRESFHLLPGTAREEKNLKQILKCARLQASDFEICVEGCPTRILKVEQGEDFINLRIQSIIIDRIPSEEQYQIELPRIYPKMPENVLQTEFVGKQRGSFFEVLIRLWT
jgi:hypothetical protein